jgi:hypothetical protein
MVATMTSSMPGLPRHEDEFGDDDGERWRQPISAGEVPRSQAMGFCSS